VQHLQHVQQMLHLPFTACAAAVRQAEAAQFTPIKKVINFRILEEKMQHLHPNFYTHTRVISAQILFARVSSVHFRAYLLR
jgi:hypothetical protein